MTDCTQQAVIDHYSGPDLLSRIDEALRRVGIDPQRVTVEELAPLDEFHSAGRAATKHGLAKLHLSVKMHIVDLGCGIGGAARYIANHHKCHVTGIDLTPEYIRIAEELTRRTGLSGDCTFHAASATDTRLPDAGFDAAVTYHAAMNIADRPALYNEAARLLKSGGQFLVYDVMQNQDGLSFPVPWASSKTESFLKSPEETRSLLKNAGFTIKSVESFRETTLDFFRKVAERTAAGQQPQLSLAPLTGQTTKQKFANYTHALEEGIVEPVFILAVKQQ